MEATKTKVMGKMDVIDYLSQKAKISKKDAENTLNAFLNCVKEHLKKGYSVRLIPFGSWEVRERKARIGRNPRTGEKIKIKARKVPAFRPGKGLRDTIR